MGLLTGQRASRVTPRSSIWGLALRAEDPVPTLTPTWAETPSLGVFGMFLAFASWGWDTTATVLASAWAVHSEPLQGHDPDEGLVRPPAPRTRRRDKAWSGLLREVSPAAVAATVTPHQQSSCARRPYFLRLLD